MTQLLRIAAVSFIVQSALWFIFSLLCILCIEEEIVPPTIDSYSNLLSSTIYQRFFVKYRDDFDNEIVVNAKVFEAFAFIHLFLSFGWFSMSIGVLQRTSRNKITSSRSLIKSWIVTGILVALEDGIFTILLIVDVSQTARNNALVVNVLMIPAVGTVLAIASRGFTLWFINVILLVIFSRTFWSMEEKPYRDEFETRYGNQYDASGHTNQGYQQQTPMPVQQPNQYVYPSAEYGSPSTSQSGFDPYRQNANNQSHGPGYPAQVPTSPYDQLNRNQQAPNPPRLHAVPPPQIPEPDYQMGPRTALKNHSQFDQY